MNFPAPAVDYRDFRLSRLNTPQYRHLWYFLFWPVYIMRYLLIENLKEYEKALESKDADALRALLKDGREKKTLAGGN